MGTGQRDAVEGTVEGSRGGGSGTGFALARALVAEGAKVVLADIDDTALAAAAATIAASGGEVLTVHTDVSALEQVEALAAATLERFGRVDIVVNNAGVIAWNSVDRLTIEAVRHKSYECALQALTINPLVPSLDSARKYLDRLIRDEHFELH